jgi:hypothetical protein
MNAAPAANSAAPAVIALTTIYQPCQRSRSWRSASASNLRSSASLVNVDVPRVVELTGFEFQFSRLGAGERVDSFHRPESCHRLGAVDQ